MEGIEVGGPAVREGPKRRQEIEGRPWRDGPGRGGHTTGGASMSLISESYGLATRFIDALIVD
jgi:hypothetical protein